MASPSPSPYGVGAVVSGKFKIVRELGVGGMGAVYEVQHVLTHHRRALKVLRVDRDKSSEGTVRLLREASAAGRMGALTSSRRSTRGSSKTAIPTS